jgi:hypothetical protein
MTILKKYAVLGYVLTLSFVVTTPLLCQGSHGFPRIGNMFWPHTLHRREVDELAKYDFLVLYYSIDDLSGQRDIARAIKENNPDMTLLMYFCWTPNTNKTPPSNLQTASEQYDWWLRDYLGNELADETWPECKLVNMTNTSASSGNHPKI